MISGIYWIRNVITGKIYVGSSVNIEKRWCLHKRSLMKDCHHSPHLQAAWNKYGKTAFTFEILEHCAMEKLLLLEQIWMDSLCSYDANFGYNIYKVAGNCLGVRHSGEFKKKMSEIRIGKKHSDETKKKISNSMLRKKVSESHSGEKSYTAKLTWKKVSEIREKYCSGNYTQQDLAQEYGVTQVAIFKVVNRFSWKEPGLKWKIRTE